MSANVGAARNALAAREREIALGGGELPDETAEEREVRRLERHHRILRLRVEEWDRRINQAAAVVSAATQKVIGEWSQFGAVIDQGLYDRFCAAAAEMRDAALLICAFGHYWKNSQPWWRWRFFNMSFAIVDPRDGSSILDPRVARYPPRWPEVPAGFLREMKVIHAEVAAAVGSSLGVISDYYGEAGAEPADDE